MSKQRPEKWYSISEESYCAFCSSANAQEKMTILQTASSQLNSILCASQRKVVEELFYRALIYSMQNQFTYSILQIFLMVMQVELEHLLDVPSGQRDAPSPLLRFQDTIRLRSVDAALPVETIKKLLTFHTDNILKYSQAYQFLFHEYPEEDDLVIRVDIHTPAIPLPLSVGVPLESNSQA
mmetsp:Transcript_54582/g.95427  ORF Transcript_54582/g.95427 Transcript_54582/m.95427 type:complete len:181 (+) Transcript_54582:7-549(+)